MLKQKGNLKRTLIKPAPNSNKRIHTENNKAIPPQNRSLIMLLQTICKDDFIILPVTCAFLSLKLIRVTKSEIFLIN